MYYHEIILKVKKLLITTIRGKVHKMTHKFIQINLPQINLERGLKNVNPMNVKTITETYIGFIFKKKYI